MKPSSESSLRNDTTGDGIPFDRPGRGKRKVAFCGGMAVLVSFFGFHAFRAEEGGDPYQWDHDEGGTFLSMHSPQGIQLDGSPIQQIRDNS